MIVEEIVGEKRVKTPGDRRGRWLPEDTHTMEVTIDLAWLLGQLRESCLRNTTGKASEMAGAIKARIIKPR